MSDAMLTWQSRIRELQAAGLTLAEIGELTGLSTSSVGDIASGRSTQPRGDAAVALHELHKTRCAEPVQAAAG